MADPLPYQIAFWIATEIQETSFLALRSSIEGALERHLPRRSREQIAELAEAVEFNVYSQLGVIADQQIRVGVDPSFLLDGELGSAYIKAQNLEALGILALLRRLSSSDFEKFCVNVLSALGARAWRVGQTADGGVDFVATDLPVSTIMCSAMSGCYPIVVGQAKGHKENILVSVTDLREFVGAAIMRADMLKREDDRLGMLSPVVYAFWTTSDFNRFAREYAKDMGLWCLGGLALAQLAHKLQLAIRDTHSSEPTAETTPNEPTADLGTSQQPISTV